MDIRDSMPNNDYDIPRWHKDGNFFPHNKEETSTSKFVTVMKGPGTLLIKGGISYSKNIVFRIMKPNLYFIESIAFYKIKELNDLIKFTIRLEKK
jgi:hypothetical protein